MIDILLFLVCTVLLSAFSLHSALHLFDFVKREPLLIYIYNFSSPSHVYADPLNAPNRQGRLIRISFILRRVSILLYVMNSSFLIRRYIDYSTIVLTEEEQGDKGGGTFLSHDELIFLRKYFFLFLTYDLTHTIAGTSYFVSLERTFIASGCCCCWRCCRSRCCCRRRTSAAAAAARCCAAARRDDPG